MITIKRKYNEKQTPGEGRIGDFTFKTLELPWKNNNRKVSCIPEGTYNCVKRYSSKYKDHIHILDVPGRDMILIHNANYVTQLLGCIAVGDAHVDINKDGLVDTTNSVATLKKIMAMLPDKFKITIYGM